MYIDRIDLSIPAEDLQSVMEAFSSAASTLELLPSVSPSDRKRYAKLGLKNEALALQIIEVGRANRHLIPAGLDFGKIDRDLVAREQLRTLKVILQGLLDRVSDSMLLTGVDLYAAALSMYHCLRRNADTASLKTTVAELKKGFSRPSRKKKEKQEAETAATPMQSSPAPAVNQTNFRQDPGGNGPADQRRDATATLSVYADKPSGAYESATSLSAPAKAVAASEQHIPALSLPPKPQTFGSTGPFLFPHSGALVFFSDGFTPSAERLLPGYSSSVEPTHSIHGRTPLHRRSET